MPDYDPLLTMSAFNTKNDRGMTALKWAKRNKHNEIAQLLHNHGVKECFFSLLFG